MDDLKQVGFSMPKEQHEKFEKEIKKMGITISSMLKHLIAEWLTKRGIR